MIKIEQLNFKIGIVSFFNKVREDTLCPLHSTTVIRSRPFIYTEGIFPLQQSWQAISPPRLR